jgi:hypothetical protein
MGWKLDDALLEEWKGVAATAFSRRGRKARVGTTQLCTEQIFFIMIMITDRPSDSVSSEPVTIRKLTLIFVRTVLFSIALYCNLQAKLQVEGVKMTLPSLGEWMMDVIHWAMVSCASDGWLIEEMSAAAVAIVLDCSGRSIVVPSRCSTKRPQIGLVVPPLVQPIGILSHTHITSKI